MLNFTMPAGIGDCHWTYAKIYELAQQREIGIRICEGQPRRTSPLIDILPNVTNLGYIDTDYYSNSLPMETDLASLPDGEFKIQCNSFLENAIKLKDIFPKQSTQYHYDFKYDLKAIEDASSFINTIPGSVKIGIYGAANKYESPWDVKDWVYFCSLLRGVLPESAFYILGAEYDTRSQSIFEALMQQKYNVVSGVGKYKIGTTIEILRGLDYYFGYPCGLGILADVVNTPCIMPIYKNFPQGLIGSYQDPESEIHLSVSTLTPIEQFNLFTQKLLHVRKLQTA